MASAIRGLDGPRRWSPPILALGFRPFYLLAAGFGVLAVPAWLLAYAGKVAEMPGLNGAVWHIHEMIFGFAAAVIAGFLLTAVRNWTGRPTASGAALGLLVLLWISGRVFIATGPYELAAIVDASFLPALALSIAIPIWRSRNVRNAKVLGIIATLALLNVAFHLAYLGIIPAEWLSVVYTAALDVLALLIAIMAGRVVPAFTANAIPDANPRQFAIVEAVAIGAIVGIAIVDLSILWWQPPSAAVAGLLAIAAVVHTVRLANWSPLSTRHNTLLLMLPLAYAWLPVHFALRALAAIGLTTALAATHALTIGAMAGLMVAMMMRSALGHTGRTLKAGTVELAVFVLLQLAALVRVTGAAVMPRWNWHATLCSGSLWTLGFLVLFVAYWPILTRARVDGRPG